MHQFTSTKQVGMCGLHDEGGVDLTEARHNVKALLQAQASLIIKFGVCLDEELKCTIESLLGYFNTIVRDLEDVGAGV